MADFNDVVKQLQANNEAEKSRDSNLNRNIASLRDSNKEAFSDFITSQQQNTKVSQELVDSQSSNKAAEIETSKESNFKDEKQLTLLEKLSKGISGIFGNMKEGAKAAGKGFMSILKGTLMAGLFIAIATFLQSPLFGKMIDYITKILIPKLKFFYDGFFGPNGGFKEGFSRLFGDDSGIGSIVLGITGVVAALAVYKVAGLFSKIKGGISKLGGFLKSVGGKLFSMKTPKGGLPGSKGGLPGVPTKAKGIVSTAGNFAKMGVSAGKGIGGFIGGILKGIASGLAAIANPLTLLGLAAVVLAINGIALAIRIMTPAFEPIGKMMDSFGASVNKVFKGIGSFVESTGKSIRSVIEGIGTAIGDVVDKLSKMSTAGTEATTKQIKELSKIPSDKLLAAAKGIDAMKAALNDFGGGTFGKIAGKLFGGGGPIDKLLDLTKEVPALMKAAEAISVISAAGGDYAMAQAELKRREKVAELEKDIAGGTGLVTSDKDIAEKQAELDALKSQKMDLKLSGNRALGGPVKAGSMYLVNERGSEMFIPNQPGQIVSAEKTAKMMGSGNMNRGNSSPTIVNAPTIKSSTNTSNSNTSSTSFIGNPDQAFAMSAGSY